MPSMNKTGFLVFFCTRVRKRSPGTEISNFADFDPQQVMRRDEAAIEKARRRGERDEAKRHKSGAD